ncbi:MAG: signal transduction histidine kinase [bacterium]|jgi:signal transduction histidine kinase
MFELKKHLSSLLGSQLLRVIFGTYLLVTFLITSIQLVISYHHVQKDISHEIQKLQKTFKHVISNSLWSFNYSLLGSILTGMKEISIVSGAKILDEKGKVIRSIGIIIDTNGEKAIVDEKENHIPLYEEGIPFTKILVQKFPLYHTDQFKKKRKIGTWIVYTSSEVVFNRVKFHFILVLINIIVKTIVLWLIFLYVIRKIVGKPLNTLIQEIEKIDYNSIEPIFFQSNTSNHHNELNILESSFNSMVKRLQQSQQEVFYINSHLEEKVEQRTKELLQSNQDLIIAKQQAEIANQAKSLFLANISHELRTPLNAIIGFSQLIAETKKLPQEHQENIHVVVSSGEHLLSIINQVLDFSKIESGTMEVHNKQFHFPQFLQEIEKMICFRLQEKHLSFKIETGNQLPEYVFADETKLRQVIINLLDNAIKFTKEGLIWLRVKIKSDHRPLLQPNFFLYFEIEDSGIGVLPSEIDKLFQNFSQTSSGKDLDRGTGLGLGLAISSRFVELLGGQIHVDRQIQTGAKFYFQIPIETPKKTSSLAENFIKSTFAPMKQYHRILVVDDASENRSLLQKLLSPYQFTVQEANDGLQAVKIWEEWEPHLIFMDLKMPELDGYKATQMIRKSSQKMQPIIIALTAYSFENEKKEALTVGCTDFVSKPFQFSQIHALIQKYLPLH